jgi:xylulokinase
MAAGFLLGFDIGSSSIKASLIDAERATPVCSATVPDTEMPITARRPGWAEQDPDLWWRYVQQAARALSERSGVNLSDVSAIGVSYQMHGLVCVDADGKPLRPSIIWCDSRATSYGEKALREIGEQRCLSSLLNSPGNFTAAKLAWVKEHEPELFAKIDTIMLPGDYICYKLTGEKATTPSGLSEAILWDFGANELARFVMDYFGFDQSLIPAVKPTFSVQGEVCAEAAAALGVRRGAPVSYRAGDQPNNALSLGVLNPGDIAATAGTSGVVYGVSDQPDYDQQSRVNTFVHVNHAVAAPRYGVLLCVNGTGILNSWLKHNTATAGDCVIDYPAMNELAQSVAPGAEGLTVLPFGNGAERTLGNRSTGAAVCGLELNTHTRAHLYRAAQEGIAFALKYGIDIMRGVGVHVQRVKAGNANMFLSPLFAQTFATATGASVELYNTDGAQGAARGAGIGAGIYGDSAEAFAGLGSTATIEPAASTREQVEEAYQRWLGAVQQALERV